MAEENVTTNDIMDFLREHMLMRGEFPAREEILTRADAADFAKKDDLRKLEKELDKLTMKVLDMDAKMDTFATKQDLTEMKHEIFGIVDGFINTQRTFEVEQAALRHKFVRYEDRLGVVEKHAGIS